MYHMDMDASLYAGFHLLFHSFDLFINISFFHSLTCAHIYIHTHTPNKRTIQCVSVYARSVCKRCKIIWFFFSSFSNVGLDNVCCFWFKLISCGAYVCVLTSRDGNLEEENFCFFFGFKRNKKRHAWIWRKFDLFNWWIISIYVRESVCV